MANEFNDCIKATMSQLKQDISNSPDEISQKLAVFQAKTSLQHLLNEKFINLITGSPEVREIGESVLDMMEALIGEIQEHFYEAVDHFQAKLKE